MAVSRASCEFTTTASSTPAFLGCRQASSLGCPGRSQSASGRSIRLSAPTRDPV